MLYPIKDRTIWIGLENLPGTSLGATGAALAYAGQSFVQPYLPVNDLLAPLANQGGVNNGGVNVALQSLGAPIALTGPTMIDMDFQAKIGDDSGVAANSLQPWYIKNIPITVKGTSYLGAYEGVSRGDNDAMQILQMYRQSLNDFAQNINGAPGTAQRFLLQFTGMPPGMDRFVGYLTDFHPTENIESVFLIDYTFSFIGKCKDNANVLSGYSDAVAALAAFGISV